MKRRPLRIAATSAALGCAVIVLLLVVGYPGSAAKTKINATHVLAHTETATVPALSTGTRTQPGIQAIGQPTRTTPPRSPRYKQGIGGGRADRPNIVFVLTDDLSFDLLPYMPGVQQLAARGMSFEDYFVSDSLCCPSRASIFTGDYPHDTGVFDNVGPDGGIRSFYANGDETHTFNIALQRAGYTTAMMGKYLNGYLEKRQSPIGARTVPPGWNDWDVAGNGYPEFDYWLNQNGRLHWYGHAAQDYLTDVLAGKAVDFINQSAGRGRPFFLEVASFAPHRPYVPAPRDRHLFPDLKAPEPPELRCGCRPMPRAGSPATSRCRSARSARSITCSRSGSRRCRR